MGRKLTEFPPQLTTESGEVSWAPGRVCNEEWEKGIWLILKADRNDNSADSQVQFHSWKCKIKESIIFSFYYNWKHYLFLRKLEDLAS